MSGTWPLTGRDREVAGLLTALDAGGAVLVGPAGVGKTRLAAHVVALAHADGRAAAVDLDAVPRVIGRVATRAVPLAPFAPLLPDAAESVSPVDAPGRLADALVQRWAGPGAPALVVDDAHALDPVSTSVLHQVAVERRVRLLVTVRRDEQVPAEVVRLWTDELLQRVEVPPLPSAVVRELIGIALDGPVEQATIDNLERLSAGNVLYLRELVLGARDAGLLVAERGVWRFTGSTTATPRLRQVVGARLGQLGSPERDALELLAVAGTLELRELTGMVDAATLESLERSGLVGIGAGPARPVELSHPLHAEVLRAELPTLARQRISRRLAASELGRPWDLLRPDQRMQRALWHLDGELSLSEDRLLAVAGEAVEGGDQVLAARLGTAAFEVGGSAAAVIMASWCRAELGERDEAERLLRVAQAAGGEPVDQAAIALRLAEDLYWGRDDPDGCDAVLDDFLAGPHGASEAARSLVRSHRPIFTVLSGRIDDALGAVAPLIDGPDPLARMQAEIPWNLANAFAGRARSTVERSGLALEAAMTGTFPYLVNPGPHLMSLGWALLLDADVAGARQIMELVYAEAARRPGISDRGWAASMLGIVLMESGRLRDATRYFVEGEAMWRRAGVHPFARTVAGLHALARHQLGDDPECATARASEHHEPRPNTMGFLEVFVARGDAWREWAAGRRTSAIEALDAAVALGHQQGVRVLAAGAAHDLARLRRPDLAVEAFDLLGPFPEAALPHLFSAHARALADDDLEALIAVFEELSAAGCLLYAAEAGLEASRLAKRRGRTKEAERVGAAAAILLGEVGPVATPAAGNARTSGPLSRREQEVATLAGRGLTNREIAAALVLSERTIENHLYRIFTKLGITSRDEITAVLDG
jgi:DNA-binding CsgD family transcriptional regulator